MSHEIRTPLSGILGNIHLLSETPLTEDQSDMLRTAKICGEQLLYLINDILGNAHTPEIPPTIKISLKWKRTDFLLK
jgi:signal transduction histidine kinase